MKFRVPLKLFADTLAPAARLSASGSPIPILANVKLQAKAGRVTLTGCDLDREAESACDADVDTEGETTLNGAKLAEIARALPKDAMLAFDISETAAKVTSGRARFSLPSLPAIDFPHLSERAPFETSVELGASDLKAALAATITAASSEETRYYLRGVYFHFRQDSAEGPGVTFIATDGHRFGRRDLALDVAPAAPSLIVPALTVKELMRLADTAPSGRARIDLSPVALRIALGAVSLTSKVVEGTYPDYERVTPQGLPGRARFDREAAIAALRRVALATTKERQDVLFDFDEERLLLTARNGEGGEACDEVACELEGPPGRVALKLPYAIDALESIGGDTTQFEFGGPRDFVKLVNYQRPTAGLAVICPLTWRD